MNIEETSNNTTFGDSRYQLYMYARRNTFRLVSESRNRQGKKKSRMGNPTTTKKPTCPILLSRVDEGRCIIDQEETTTVLVLYPVVSNYIPIKVNTTCVSTAIYKSHPWTTSSRTECKSHKRIKFFLHCRF